MNSEVKAISIIGIITILVIVGGLSLVSKTDTNKTPVTINPELLISTTSPTFGSESATVSIIEFGDFACPACAMLQPNLDQVFTSHTDDVKLSLRLIPIHNAESYNSAIAAYAAKNQNKFFEYGHILYAKQEDWFGKANQRDLFIEYAKSLNLNTDQFTKDIDSVDFQNSIRQILDTNNSDAMTMGINSTPTMVLNGQTTLIGVKSAESINQEIEKLKLK